ncbi:amidase [Ramlibacter rhizophilus]|uniref:Amidase n=1 Tax=Ramlibacter rhizophilus TaxID=1781167 RepID=A0A4Z0BQK8_9BURK|nr:amidase [Ramlibacter rhizophilus]TFZ01606.1 amidase [Ramlibacter rhizophilus]
MTTDLIDTLEAIRAGRLTSPQALSAALDAARSPACHDAFLQRFEGSAVQPPEGAADLPLGGLPVSVKDLFDIAGQPTPAGSQVLRDAPPAAQDAPAVARLKAAGGVVVGRTHMTEFAFSGVGTNPHFRVPANPAATDVPRIPGGSSSGAAVSVACGAAFVGLGSDTGGSIRIPAALCGLVGFKNTARLTPTEGALPLSTTLDTVCAITRSVRDAVLAHEVLSGRTVSREARPLPSLRLGVPSTQLLDDLDETVARAFERCLRLLREGGARVEEVPLEALQGLSGLQASGGFAAAESYAWHRELLATQGERYDPRVRLRIERGAGMKAWEYLDLVKARRAWIADMERATGGFDALLSPTVPMVAPPIASLAPADGRDPAADAQRDQAFFRTNALLLRNPSVVNMLDGCAISLPCHVPGELPAGIMVWHGALRDDTVLQIASQLEALLAPLRGH